MKLYLASNRKYLLHEFIALSDFIHVGWLKLKGREKVENWESKGTRRKVRTHAEYFNFFVFLFAKLNSINNMENLVHS